MYLSQLLDFLRVSTKKNMRTPNSRLAKIMRPREKTCIPIRAILRFLELCELPDLGPKYIEKYSNTLQLLSLINDYNYIIITGPVEM